MIKIYTDGSCLKNPNGEGGWAFITIENDRIWEVSGGEESTTNNKMELLAIINALKFNSKNIDIEIYTDSQYVVNGITKWIKNWIKRDRKDIKNLELWMELYGLTLGKNIKWNWIKAHNGDIYNERVDELAKKEAHLMKKRKEICSLFL